MDHRIMSRMASQAWDSYRARPSGGSIVHGFEISGAPGWRFMVNPAGSGCNH
jgi:hypothetical protein